MVGVSRVGVMRGCLVMSGFEMLRGLPVDGEQRLRIGPQPFDASPQPADAIRWFVGA
jgi:hypothetical protein